METITDLHAWLLAHGVDTATWGEGTSKSVRHLWQELCDGDCVLVDGPPRRVVAVVQITIRRGGLTLVEVGQELDNGRFRFRNHLPAEKIKSGESVDAAARRCLQEELGVDETAVTLLPITTSPHPYLTASPSYPGLLTAYTFHQVAAHVAPLPDDDFWRDNLAARTGDPIRRHLWGWRSAPPPVQLWGT
jgi:ADP-ribose pyrophosphatase YjhB (NUDIX family)